MGKKKNTENKSIHTSISFSGTLASTNKSYTPWIDNTCIFDFCSNEAKLFAA